MKASIRFDQIIGAVPAATGELLQQIVATAAAEGVEVYLVGGPVRDLLLGRSLTDVDLMLESDARALGEAVVAAAPEGRLRLVEHSRFGTLRIESEEARIDLARMRHERYAHPGALPDVEEGRREQDVARRDFSVNALLCPLRANAPSRAQPVIDLVGGLEDLTRRRLRVLHSRSFHDDPTRAWRAARFAARLGFTLDRSSRSALRDALRDGAFGAVSGERFRRVLQLVFEEAERGTHPGRILRLLADWHVLAALEPGLTLGRDRMIPLRRLGKTIERPEWSAPRWRPWVAGLSIWLAPLPAALRRRTLDRFSIRGEQAKRIVHFGRDSDRLLGRLAKARGRGAVDALLSEMPEEAIQALHALASVSVRRRILRWAAEDRRRRLPVNGGDLTQLGLAGPDVGRAIARIRAGFLDGEVANREEALALAEEIARRASRRSARGARSGKARQARRPVAAKSAITDTPDHGRRSPTPPGTASPQADPSR
jgi:tRNA nucleotidyltransferase (CCA-adding enzyme)